jgi:hypothetical protein
MATVDATSLKVQRILAAEFSDVRLTKSGFSVPYESTTAFVEVREWSPDKDGNPRSIVYIWAPIGRQVKPSPEMYHWAATDGRKRMFGGVTVVDGEGGDCFLTYDHALLGDFLDPAELAMAVGAIVTTANDFDEIVHDRFGGKRHTDPDDPA